MEMSGQLHARPLYPRYALDKRLGGSAAPAPAGNRTPVYGATDFSPPLDSINESLVLCLEMMNVHI